MSFKMAAKIKKARILMKRGDLNGAQRLCEKILGTAPKSREPLRLLYSIYKEKNNFSMALGLLYKLAEIERLSGQDLFEAGMMHLQLSEHLKAIACLRESVKIDESNSRAWSRLSGVAGQLGYLRESMTSGQRAVQLDPASVVSHMNLATAYDEFGHTELALRHYKRAVELDPNNAIVQCKLGDALSGTKDMQAAKQCYQKAIQIQPKYTVPYRQLSRIVRCSTADDENIVAVERLLKDASIADVDKVNLHFALGKMYEDCQLYEQSFRHLVKGNHIQDARHKFDSAKFAALVSKTKSYFSSSFVKSLPGSGSQSAKPVFIVGMPRSGSTLTEQIIACHPQGFAGGEMYWFDRIESRVQGVIRSQVPYPECLRDADQKVLRELANEYLAYIESISGSASYERVTDKMLGNFLHLGLIFLLFPNTKVIHCKRDPMDTCFSIFSTMFPGNLDFGYSLKSIAFVYKQYHDLMKYWIELFPDNILTVSYEELVGSQESVARKLVKFIGLDWSDKCLNLSENRSRVRTISAYQVRRGLYSSSVGRWKRFQAQLSELKSDLSGISD